MRIETRNASRALATIMTVFLLTVTIATVSVGAKPKIIKVPDNYPTIQEAINSALPGDKIIVGPGEYYGAIVNKSVEIMGEGGAVIVDGPPYGLDSTINIGFFLEAWTSSGATISGFTFFVDLPVFGRVVDEVTVEHNIMNAPFQGVTCVCGNRWVIRYNDINGLTNLTAGGLGIWIVSSWILNLPANDNLVAFNKITADFPFSIDINAGIALSSWGGQVTGNKVVYNRIVMTGWIGWTFAIAMAAWNQTLPPQTYMLGNMIGFNDLRRSSYDFVFCYPPELVNYNVISRNLGENRAYDGVPPHIFNPAV